MTKNEFTQQAALRLITAHPEARMSDLAGMARKLANEIYGEDEPIPALPAELDAEPIENLLKEIDRRDREDVERRKALNQKDFPGWRLQKGGFYKRLSKVFRENEIETVGDLISARSYKFLHMKNVGQLCFARVNKILEDTYGITAW